MKEAGTPPMWTHLKAALIYMHANTYDELQSFQHISVTSWKWVDSSPRKQEILKFVLFETKAAINAIDCSPKHYVSEVCFMIIIAFYF